MLPEHFCALCRTPFLNSRPLDENGVCRLCRSGVTRFDAAYGYGDYHGRLRDLVHLFKYGRIRGLASHLGRMMMVAFPRDQHFDVIVPMPMHWRKRLTRGFNQSELLARVLSKHTAIPVLHALTKKRHTNAQAGLSRAQRRQNVSRVFTARKAVPVQGKRILLVDDVFTTGATANAAAEELKQAGAVRVSVFALARADRRASYGTEGGAAE